MLNYSELSKPQKAVIKALHQGHELQWEMDIGQFQIHQKNGMVYRAATSTVDSLIVRHFIECHFKDDKIEAYRLNAQFLTPENLKAMEKEDE
jgi:hypothetical protein